VIENSKKSNSIIFKGNPLFIKNKIDNSILNGATFTIKDNISIKDWQLSCASFTLKNYKSLYNATVVDKILNNGGVIIGKTNHDEFAMGSSSERSIFGSVKNSSNDKYVAGGSSGGSAVSVALEISDFSLGSDTGGSIRQPASFCGVFGLKPTYGRVSRYGLVAFASSFDQIGPFSRSTLGLAKCLEVISGYDEKDSTSSKEKVPPYSKNIEKNIPKKIGIPWELIKTGTNKEILNKLNILIDFLKKNNCEIIDIKLPNSKYAIAAYYILTMAEASSNLARFDGVRYGFRDSSNELESMYLNTRSKGFGDEVKRRIILGTYVLSSGYYDAFFKKGQQVRRLIKNDFENVFKNVDVILLPTSPTPAFKQGENLSDPLKMYLSDVFTTPVSLAGLPALSFPAGKTKNKLPIGLQLIGNYFKEETILNFSHYIEKNFNFD
tara:strand:- start:2462 stop:3772 length:1311 start_codon:yes stop_codon:yes gene_type:complete